MNLPEIIDVNGVEFKATVFLINTKRTDGAPALCTMIRDNHYIDLHGGEQFMIAYVSVHMLHEQDDRDASDDEDAE